MKRSAAPSGLPLGPPCMSFKLVNEVALNFYDRLLKKKEIRG